MTTFSTQEIDLASDPTILLIKNRIMEKATMLLGEFEQLIKEQLVSKFTFDRAINTNNGKISKGENYKFLPYLMLDYPAYFTKSDVFALRSMFYWGNFVSFTLHLRGKYLQTYASTIINEFKNVDNTYFCINHTEWEYHYKASNYCLLSELSEADVEEQISENGFIKISSKVAINDIHTSPKALQQFINHLTSAFSKH